MATLALCIPAFNASWCLPKLLESVRNQSLPFDEVLLYDDCSSDNTAEIARVFGATVISGTTNRGCSFGKNQLATHAKSDWLFFLDSDDMLLPCFTKTVQQRIQTDGKNADLILLSYKYVDSKTGELKHIPEYDQELLKADPVRFMINTKVVNSSVVRREKFLLINGFDTDQSLLYIEDRAYAIKTALHGFRYTWEQVPCFQINCYEGSMSSKKPELWMTAAVHLWQKVANEVDERYHADISRQLFINALWAAKYNLWKNVDESLALAKKISAEVLPDATKPFQLLYRVWPLGAFYLRNKLFRILKVNL